MLGMSQAEVARVLGWRQPKIAKIEAAQQDLSLTELEQLVGVLGVDVLAPITHEIEKEFTPDMMDKYEEEALNARVSESAPPPISNKYLLATNVLRFHRGAQVPKHLLCGEESECARKLKDARLWLQDRLDRLGVDRARLRGLQYAPALDHERLQTLQRPRSVTWAPLAPHLKSVVRGTVMVQPTHRIVFHPGRLNVTVLNEMMVVLYPLMVVELLPRQGLELVDEVKDADEIESLAFRIAGLMASSWMRAWVQRQDRAARRFAIQAFPIPAKLWSFSDDEGGRVESLVRRIWESDGGKAMAETLWRKDLDALINPLMATLPHDRVGLQIDDRREPPHTRSNGPPSSTR